MSGAAHCGTDEADRRPDGARAGNAAARGILNYDACDDRLPTRHRRPVGSPARSGPPPWSREAKPNWRERNNETMQAKAALGWPFGLPGWVAALAAHIDAHGLKAAARRVGYSAATLSQVCHDKYSGNLAAVEARVTGTLLGERLDCPVMGPMRRDVCLDWQMKPRSAASSLNNRMRAACAACPQATPDILTSQERNAR